MGNLFGIRRRAPVVTAQDRAILQLKQQRDKIKIYQRRTENDLEKSRDLALKLFQNGFKERALVVLRRKKYMEDILSRTDKQLETLEQLVSDIEYTQIEVNVVEGLKVGTEALKQLNNLMNIDDIQQMMEDNEEASEKQREISDILQRSSERCDEDDLLKELQTYQDAQTMKPAIAIDSSSQDDLVKDSRHQLPDTTSDAEVRPPTQRKMPPITTGDIPLVNSNQQSMEDEIGDLPDVPEDLPIIQKRKNEEELKKEARQLETA